MTTLQPKFVCALLIAIVASSALFQSGVAKDALRSNLAIPEFLSVQSITREDPNPTNAASVDFVVDFAEPVTGVDDSDFSLTVTGVVTGASISGVVDTGDQTLYAVTVDTGTANGTIRLDLNASGTGIKDLAGNPISGGFTDGEVYLVDKNLCTATVLVKDISPAEDSTPGWLMNLGSMLFFSANDGIHGNELWKSDGTANSTLMVKDIDLGGGSFPSELTAMNGMLFFQANDGTHGTVLWVSNGTADGTRIVKDINPGLNTPPELTAMNNLLFFRANDGTHGMELWKSDGTADGTLMVKDINPDGDSNPNSLTNINGVLYFSANDGIHGQELWRSDGTTTGTFMVKDIVSGSGWSSPASFKEMNGMIFFSANRGVNNIELWRSDGTADDTRLVKDINPNGNSNPTSLTEMNGTLFFRALHGIQGIYGYELWKSDGTADGTLMVKDINPTGHSTPEELTVMSDTLFFRANDGVHGFELWKSDGTADGTLMVNDINPTGHSIPQGLVVFNDTLFFQADDGVHGVELWKSDGTTTGTALFRDINLNGDSSPANLTKMNGMLFFFANDGINSRELWRYDPQSPDIVSITRAGKNPASASSVDFNVTLCEPVVGVDISDFSLTTMGVTDALISNLADIGDQTHYTITVNTGSGNGTIRLDLNDTGTDIEDLAGNPIGGGFTGSEIYTIYKNPAPFSLDFGEQLFHTSNPAETVTVTNIHSTSITLGALLGSSEVGTTWNTGQSFFFQNDTCSGATLAVSASCTFDVEFLPWSLGTKSGTITIPSDAPDAPYTLTLTGESVPGAQYLLNRSFDNYAVSTGLPNLWLKNSGFKVGIDGVDNSWSFHGPYSVKLVGDGDLKVFSQRVDKTGLAGDDFSFFVTAHAENIPADADRWLMQVMFYNGNTIVENRNVPLKPGTYEFKRITRTYTAKSDYTHIMFRVHFGKSSGTAWLDLASLQWAP